MEKLYAASPRTSVDSTHSRRSRDRLIQMCHESICGVDCFLGLCFARDPSLMDGVMTQRRRVLKVLPEGLILNRVPGQVIVARANFVIV
jgi:hypothetical protein